MKRYKVGPVRERRPMNKKITLAQYEKNGVKYQSTLQGHLTRDQMLTAMLFQKHIPKHMIRKHEHAVIRSN